ncbi:MAG: DEAD/DEAH box helicase family protein [Ignavibacteria bacterium]|nr:DEAD/DEAH box helicase family protein [Ignavibacteria bacterium]MBK6420286.1 DEAD/DEAH box helicase family protein [Ignavibacteria bacterium]MBK7412762.1 DEAD/DEAH box helicase family protein [Ignavibacteria bacterium]
MKPKSLIINSPYSVPTRHWVDDGVRFNLVEGRRPASYEIFDPVKGTRRSEELVLVNQIRERVDEWRAQGYPNVTTVTRELLEHWNDRSHRLYPFYYCQLEAVETLIWWVEGPANAKQGINIPGDGGPFDRICNKMATGSGKTTLMGMIITWQALNAMMFPRETKRFSKAIFIVAPGITVRDRLQVLMPGDERNVYDEFVLCPTAAMRQKLNGAVILNENWHSLMPLKQSERSVVKKGQESDKAFVRRVLGPLAAHKDIIVINDEAHHAYRFAQDDKSMKKAASEAGIDVEESTKWIEGLDRIHGQLRINRCFDLTATPFVPSGKKAQDQALFSWIVSDFGLNDAIEAGLVKTPRVVVRDGVIPDTKTLKPKLYHLYREPEVGEDLNRRGALPHEALPLLVQQAYALLAHDWREAKKAWKSAGQNVPPVMLTVCNRTETAARIEHYLNSGDALIPELTSPHQTLRVDSRVLEKAEIGESASTDKDYEQRLKNIIEATDIPIDAKERLLGMKKEELLRELVDTVGRQRKAGQDLQSVISVAMLSEGWDAKNVTHIMGLRAFSSQLLCEQVIGRGLRRVSYEIDEETGFFKPEYVNVFGVPLTIFERESEGGDAPPPPKESHQIESLNDRAEFEIVWPNVLRVEHVVRPELVVMWDDVEPLIIDPSKVVVRAELAPALGGAEDFSRVTSVDLARIPDDFRFQTLVFKAAKKAWLEMDGVFAGRPEYLLIQLVRLAEQFLTSEKVRVLGPAGEDPVRRRILIGQSMDRVVQHLVRYINAQNVETLECVFDDQNPRGSTANMRTWWTTRPTRKTEKCHANKVVTDGAWESFVANHLDVSPNVNAWIKNDHLNFHITYLWNGSRRRYIPDFLVRLSSGETLIMEIKGEPTDESKAKKAALDLWVQAVNSAGGWGTWRSVEVRDMAEVERVV